MSYLTVGDIFNTLTATIRGQFPAVRFYFVGKESAVRPELLVYVLDKAKASEVGRYCRVLERRPTEPPIRIAIKVFRGAPDTTRGESEVALQRKREDFMRRVKEPGRLRHLG